MGDALGGLRALQQRLTDLMGSFQLTSAKYVHCLRFAMTSAQTLTKDNRNSPFQVREVTNAMTCVRVCCKTLHK